MSNIAVKRLKRELQEFQKPNDKFTLEMVDNNIFHLKGSLKGPPDTPFAGGTYYLDILLSDRYPFVPPRFKFINHVWHPNISSVTGVICLDILQTEWVSSLTLQGVLISLQVLLQDPRADNPQDAPVAHQYINNRQDYNRTAAYWNELYAKPNKEGRRKYPDYEEKLKQFSELFPPGQHTEDKLIAALSSQGWNIQRAYHTLS